MKPNLMINFFKSTKLDCMSKFKINSNTAPHQIGVKAATEDFQENHFNN